MALDNNWFKSLPIRQQCSTVWVNDMGPSRITKEVFTIDTVFICRTSVLRILIDIASILYTIDFSELVTVLYVFLLVGYPELRDRSQYPSPSLSLSLSLSLGCHYRLYIMCRWKLN